MNILVLTPDRVGSTLLQRLLTVSAVINQNHEPLTVNLHELTNGLTSYYNDDFKRQTLGKIQGQWGYHQSLETITDLLQNCQHDKIARLARYHIEQRRDEIGPQRSFYQYLNDNFYIIATRRRNVFEHAVSWAIANRSKNMNVFSHDEKLRVFENMTREGLTVQPDIVTGHLESYKAYLEWVERHFNVNAWFEYERDLPNIEQYILNLDPWANTLKLQWQDRWDISFNDWNRVHYLLSLVKFGQAFTDEEKEFMTKHIDKYKQIRQWIDNLLTVGVLPSGIPIKLHTLHEKAKLINNISDCLLTYNKWVQSRQPTWALPHEPQEMLSLANTEHVTWRGTEPDNMRSPLLTNDPAQQRLLSHNQGL